LLVLLVQIVKPHLLRQLLMLLLQLLVLDDITLYLYSMIRYLTNLRQRLLLKGILLLLLEMKVCLSRLSICLLVSLNFRVQLLLLLPQMGPEEWWTQIWIVIDKQIATSEVPSEISWSHTFLPSGLLLLASVTFLQSCGRWCLPYR
jgi:hypothetical protein